MATFINLAGKRFGRLVVIGISHNTHYGHYWECICDCGKNKKVFGGHLRNGKTKSCGCLNQDTTRFRNTTHGMTKTRIFVVWQNMIKRCENPNNHAYNHYGGRGIKVCNRWHQFARFFEDMGLQPTDKHQIDRTNNDKGYCKENCKWVLPQDNSRNRRNNVNLTIDGVTDCVVEWAKQFSISAAVVYSRIKKGWGEIEALTTPPLSRKIKLDAKQIEEIKILSKTMPQSKIAAKYNVCQQTISNVITSRTWGNI